MNTSRASIASAPIFVSDNDDDGNQQTRICYVMPGGNYGYHPRGPGQTHWHEEQPGVVPKILRTYFGSPTGMCVYEGTLLPKKYRGQLLHTDAGPRHVRCYHLKPERGRLRRGPRGHGDQHRQLVPARRTSASRRTAACSSPTGTIPASAATAWATRRAAASIGWRRRGTRSSVPKVDLVDARKDLGRAGLAEPGSALHGDGQVWTAIESRRRSRSMSLSTTREAEGESVSARSGLVATGRSSKCVPSNGAYDNDLEHATSMAPVRGERSDSLASRRSLYELCHERNVADLSR